MSQPVTWCGPLPPDLPARSGPTLAARVRLFRRIQCLSAIGACGGDKRAAAHNLGIGYSTLKAILADDA